MSRPWSAAGGATRTPETEWSTPSYHGPRTGGTGASRTVARPGADGGHGHRYAPGLDGVRALAVSAVLVYHLGASWLPGGFLGVDVFFVLSGFLITSLLVAEWQRRGRISIKRFYLRRARRLLPALFTLLAVVVIVTAIFAPSELARLRGDVVAALVYVTNWTQILWNRSYFAALGRPSLLQHLWSLAVEEQFYLIWPLILVACLASRCRWVPPVVTLVGIGASSALMAALFTPHADPSRVYYGSDTHAAPLLVGALLALAVTQRARRGSALPRAAGPTWPFDLLSLGGAAVVAYYMVEITYYDAGLYQGGFVVVGVATAAVVYAAAREGSVTSRVLGVGLLRWIGVRSYGIYLWHWPIFMLTRPGIDLPVKGLPVVVLRLGVSVLAAALSYRFIEQPIRTRGFGATLRGASRHASSRRLRPAAILVGIAAIVAVVGTQLVGLGTGNRAQAARGIQYDPGARPTITVTAPAPTPAATPTAPATSSASPAAGTPTAARKTSNPAPPPQPPFPRPVRVGFFGDSQGMTLLINKPAGLDGALTTTDDTIEGCGIFGGIISSTSGQSRNLGVACAGWPDKWHASAEQQKPQVAVIQIGAWEVFDVNVNGTELKFGTPPWDQYFNQQLATGIQALTSAGAQVALLSVPCFQPISAGGLQALPERGDNARTAHINTLLQAAAAKNPQRVLMIQSPKQFCTDASVVGNTAYRWDGVHFYKPGAALEFQVITPQLLAIPQPPAAPAH